MTNDLILSIQGYNFHKYFILILYLNFAQYIHRMVRVNYVAVHVLNVIHIKSLYTGVIVVCYHILSEFFR